MGLLKGGQQLRQAPCLNFRQQLHNLSFRQLFVTSPKETGVTVALGMKENTLAKVM